MAIGTSNLTSHPSGLTRRQRYEAMRTQLQQDRSTFDSMWKDLAEYFQPRRTRFTTSDRNQGGRRSQSIIDSTPVFAFRTLQSGMHAGLTSPARPWMRLTTADPDLAEFKAVKSWLHTVTQRMLTIFLRSNLYNALPMVYGDMGLFATSAVSFMEDDQDLLRAKCYPVGSYWIGLDARGNATTFVREYRMTVRQMVEEFGVDAGSTGITWSRFSNQVKDLWTKGEYDVALDVLHVITPNEEYDASKLSARYTMKWKSCYFEAGREEKDYVGEGFLRESGHNEFPVMAPRWDVNGDDTYGTYSPGIIALGDAKQLQLMQRRKAQAIEKAINPPLVGPTSLRNTEVTTLPGRITYDDAREGMQGLRPIHEVRLEGLQHMLVDSQETRERIREAFYADLFLMLAQSEQTQPITAEEVRARQEEKLIALGPVLERTNDELLDPGVDRVFAMMLRAGVIPPPPPELEGVDLKVEYLSIMAQAQKLIGVVGQDRFLTSVANLAEMFPRIRHKVVIFKAVDRYQDMLGVDPSLVRSDEEADAMAQQEEQAAAAAQQAAQMKDLGAAASSLAAAPLSGPPTALSAVIDGMGA